MEFAQWAWGAFLETLHHEQVRAVFAGLLIGMALTETLARFLPAEWDPRRADRIVRLVVFGASMCSSFQMIPTATGFVYAAFSGLAAPTLYSFGTRAIYARWPALKPEALKPCP